MTNPLVTRTDLERWALGDLDPAHAEAIAEQVARDPRLSARAERVRRDLDATESAVPPLREPWRAVAPRPWRPGAWSLGVVALAAAALLFVLVPSPDPPTQLVRGSAFDLEAYRVRERHVDAVGAIVEVQAEDHLQLRIKPAGSGFLHVFDLQDDGAVSAWLTASPVEAGQRQEVAAVLDAYPGSERVYVVLADAPVTIERVRSALSGGAAPVAELDVLPGLDGATQRSLLLVRTP